MRYLNEEKEKSIIDKVLPISLVNSETVINLFYDKSEEVNYILYTDGCIEHLNTFLDDHPHQRDLFLKGCGRLTRLEFIITDAKVLLVEKNRKDNKIKNLYIDFENINNLIIPSINRISSSENGKVMIKKVVSVNGN